LNLNHPSSIIGRTYTPILEPETDYEKNGIINNVVFSCGAIVMENTLYFYYGAGDKVTALASLRLSELLERLKP
jgi:predicted GH43/DUF377 family glycosyl hydrolase